MSVKVKQALNKCLEQIENDSFDEDVVRTLLIVSRDYLRNEGLIKELAHFIAHPVRYKGMFHERLNNRYTKFKLVEDQVLKYDISELQKKIKTEDELSDFMLSGISVEKIDSKLFDILYSDGLNDLPEEHLKKYTGLNKKEIKKLFEDYYTKKNGFYYLSTNKTENLINTFRSLPKTKYNPEKETEIADQLTNTESLVNKIKSRIDSVQKVIRGAIYFNSVFDTKTLHAEIESVIKHLIKQFNLDQRFVKVIKNHIDEILLCVMTLLHDSKFVFYDKNEARAYLCFYLNYNPEHLETPNFSVRDELYSSGVIALYISYKSKDKINNLPLFVSDLPIKKYLDYNIYKTNPIDSYNSEIRWITASRIDNELQLT